MSRIPDTQRGAYESIGSRLPEKRAKVYQTIAISQGLTLFEIAARLGWQINCISGRVTELAKQGHIVDSGNRRTNPLSGHAGIVWVRARKGQLEFL